VLSYYCRMDLNSKICLYFMNPLCSTTSGKWSLSPRGVHRITLNANLTNDLQDNPFLQPNQHSTYEASPLASDPRQYKSLTQRASFDLKKSAWSSSESEKQKGLKLAVKNANATFHRPAKRAPTHTLSVVFWAEMGEEWQRDWAVMSLTRADGGTLCFHNCVHATSLGRKPSALEQTASCPRVSGTFVAINQRHAWCHSTNQPLVSLFALSSACRPYWR